MAVKDESLHHATENLILPKPRKYYKAAIFNSHWQLRSLIASPEAHIVYYPTSNDIIALNTETRERETVTSLPFPPRCLTASKDWICIGGEQGNYAAISLKETNSHLSNLDLDADARLPLDLDPARRRLFREAHQNLRRYGESSRRTNVKVTKVGTEIVNCVTLWVPGKDVAESSYKMPVAVVSNNDCTVTILNLENSQFLQQLVLPDYVNRSVISPNGALLATISDDPYLYIHERARRYSTSKETKTASASDQPKEYAWTLRCKIQLEGQKPAEKSEMRGSFAACFSRSGKYLAVATQYGIISVFDVETITEPESLVATFTTSRPSSGNNEPWFAAIGDIGTNQRLERDCGGAVRAMEFSPDVFDLLAWTESTGRVGVADVRTMFFSRQLLKLEPKAEAVERVHVIDKIVDPVVDPRLRSYRPESYPGDTSLDSYYGSDIERRRLRPLIREMLDRHQAPPTAEELEVLHAHRLARRQRDLANSAPEEPVDNSSISMWASANDTESNDRRLSSSGLPAALREFINPDRSTASFRSFINERNQDRERRSQQQDSRRRSAAMLTAVENAIERETLGSSAAGDSNDASSALERLTLTARQALPPESSNGPWAEIDALYRSRFPTDPPLDRSTRLRVEVEEDEDRRDFAHRLRQPWRPSDDNLRINLTAQERQVLMTVGTPVHHSIETMGCCWSENGRILYAGGSDGIYEYHVNVAGRKMFPSLVLR